jgi:hypothetical protein
MYSLRHTLLDANMDVSISEICLYTFVSATSNMCRVCNSTLTYYITFFSIVAMATACLEHLASLGFYLQRSWCPGHRSPSNVCVLMMIILEIYANRLISNQNWISDTSKNNPNFAAAMQRSCAEPFLLVKQDDLNRSPPFVLKTDTLEATKRKTKTDVHKSG